MENPLYIGLGGVAGSGKDTFYSYLKKELNKKEIKIIRYSFGDELKREVNRWTTAHYDIDSLKCSREEKEMIRPLLIAHGTIKRKKSNGQYWIKKVTERINREKEIKALNPHGEKLDIICITDVRYNHYNNDEVTWVKKQHGVLVYVERLVKDQDTIGLRHGLKPQNPEEITHDPKVKAEADYIATIKDVEEFQIPDVFQKEIKKLIKWIKEEGGPEWTNLLT